MQEAILIEEITKFVMDRLWELAPKKTKNLANHGISCKIWKKTSRVYIDLKEAPYMPYTNEPWLDDIWKGKKNPNEAWWNNAMKIITQELAQKYGGELENVGTE